MNRSAGGWILIVLGLVVLIWGSFGFKTRKDVLDVGPLHATKDVTHHVPYAPIFGGLIIVGGVILLVSSRSKA